MPLDNIVRNMAAAMLFMTEVPVEFVGVPPADETNAIAVDSGTHQGLGAVDA